MKIKYITLIFALFTLSNCAHNKLTVSIDLYKGELPEKQIDTESLAVFYAEASRLSSLSRNIAQQKIGLANSFFQTYKNYAEFYFKLDDPSYTYDPRLYQNLETEKDNFIDQVSNRFDLIENEINNFRSILDRIANSDLVDQNRLDLLVSVNKVISEIENLSNYTDRYNQRILGQWEEGLNDLNALITNGATPDPKELNKLVNSIDSYLQKLVEYGLLQSGEVETLSKFTNQLKIAYDDNSFLTTNILLSESFAEIPSDLTPSDRKYELSRFINDKTFLFSQIDKLQDFGHRDWKVIAKDKDNNALWVEEFAKTYFRAEGNSSIVLVRDSPIGFRPQTVNNDPSSLIQNQLQISRATAGLAITIGTALNGINLDLDNYKSGSTPTDPSETIGGETIYLEKENEFRESTIETLLENLRLLKRDLEINGGTTSELNRIKQELDLLATAYSNLFKKD